MPPPEEHSPIERLESDPEGIEAGHASNRSVCDFLSILLRLFGVNDDNGLDIGGGFRFRLDVVSSPIEPDRRKTSRCLATRLDECLAGTPEVTTSPVASTEAKR